MSEFLENPGTSADGSFYETPARLMDKAVVTKIQGIMQFSDSSLNNFEPLPEPPRAGAGRVSKYRKDQQSDFILPPDQSQSTEQQGHNTVVNRHLEEVEPLAEADELDPQNWPFHETNDAFKLLPSEITKRAAWSWYRSGLLYERAASALANDSPDRSNISNEHLETMDEDVLTSSLRGLRYRAKRAQEHALALYPDLLQEESLESASWGEAWTEEDDRYYAEMTTNCIQERMAAAVHLYKKAATRYIIQGLECYIEDKQANELAGTPKSDPQPLGVFLEKATEECGGLVQLWGEAAKWSFGERVLPQWLKQFQQFLVLETHRNPRDDFKEWWERAAFAIGHSAWLEGELNEMIFQNGRGLQSGSIQSETLRLDDWRLVPPGEVGHYNNDCVARSNYWAKSQLDPSLPGLLQDQFLTAFNSLHQYLRDSDSHNHGVPSYSFVYGPPDFVYFSREKTGWTSERLGLLDSGIRAALGGSKSADYERYKRIGILDCLPSSASRYEKVLAISADDIIVKLYHETLISQAFEAISFATGHPPQELEAVASKLRNLVQRRRTITKAAADMEGFKNVVKFIINKYVYALFDNEYIRSMNIPYLSLILEVHVILLHVERTLNEVLRPYYTLTFKFLPGGKPFLYDPSDAADDPRVAEVLKRCKSSYWWMEYTYKMMRHFKLEMIREAMQTTGKIPEEHLELAKLYEETLVTGDIDKLPFVTAGRIESRKRDLALHAFVKPHDFNCGKECRCKSDPHMQQLTDSLLSGKKPLSEEEKDLCKMFEAYFAQLKRDTEVKTS